MSNHWNRLFHILGTQYAAMRPGYFDCSLTVAAAVVDETVQAAVGYDFEVIFHCWAKNLNDPLAIVQDRTSIGMPKVGDVEFFCSINGGGQ